MRLLPPNGVAPVTKVAGPEPSLTDEIRTLRARRSAVDEGTDRA